MSSEEKISIIQSSTKSGELEKDPLKIEISAIIPLRAHYRNTVDLNETLVRKCAESINESRYINKVIVSSDDEELFNSMDHLKNADLVMRPESLSDPSVRLVEVLQYTLSKLEKDQNYLPDVLVPVEITYPFRPQGIFDNVIEMLVQNEFDTVITGVAEYRVCWKKENGRFVKLTELTRARDQRSPLHIGLPSLACALYPRIISQGDRYGDNIGIFEVDDPFASIEVRSPEQLKRIAKQLYWPE